MPKLSSKLKLRCHEIDGLTRRALEGSLAACLEGAARDRRYTFKSRFKGPERIMAKVARKRTEGARLVADYDQMKRDNDPKATEPGFAQDCEEARKLTTYGPEHITDAFGCRYVTLYQSGIPQTVTTLLQTLETFNEVEPDPVTVREFVIYTNRPRTDPISIVNETMEIMSRYQLTASLVREDAVIRDPETRKSAYSSIHLVLERQMGDEPAASFEVQIRDIFEEGWGEVQHNLLYSQKDEEDGLPKGEEESWQLHLNALKTFVDGCSQHASIIKKELERFRSPPAPSVGSQSVSEREKDLEEIVRVLRVSGARADVWNNVREAYVLLLSAENEAQRKGALRTLGDSQKAFDKAIDLISPMHGALDVRPSYSVRYYLEIERANCTFLIGQVQEISTDQRIRRKARASFVLARTRYETIIGDEHRPPLAPRDPAVWLRLEKVATKLASCEQDLVVAENYLSRCIDLIDDDPTTGPDHWIALSSRTDRGLLLWKRSQMNRGVDRIALLMDSIAATEEGYRKWEGQNIEAKRRRLNWLAAHKAASNILYYSAHVIFEDKSRRAEMEPLIRTYMERLTRLGIDSYRDYFRTRDNLMHAWHALGVLDKATALAGENFYELRGVAERRTQHTLLDVAMARTFLNGAELTCFDSAHALLSAAQQGLDGIN